MWDAIIRHFDLKYIFSLVNKGNGWVDRNGKLGSKTAATDMLLYLCIRRCTRLSTRTPLPPPLVHNGSIRQTTILELRRRGLLVLNLSLGRILSPYLTVQTLLPLSLSTEPSTAPRSQIRPNFSIMFLPVNLSEIDLSGAQVWGEKFFNPERQEVQAQRIQ